MAGYQRRTTGNKPIDITIPPGMVLRESLIASEGRWIDGDKVRFVRGYPEKIGGWERYGDDQLLGVARGGFTWSDLDARSWGAIGTHRRLYAVDSNRATVNITPTIKEVTLVDVLSVTSGETLVTMDITAHGASPGYRMVIAGAGTIGGVSVDLDVDIVEAVDADTVTFDLPTAAIVTEAGAGGSIDVIIEIAPGAEDPVFGVGYGSGFYGSGFYGTPRDTSGIVLQNRSWTLGNMGKLLMACPTNGPIYTWDPTASPVPRATLLTGTDLPGAARGIFVTDERFLVAYGASPDTGIGVDTMRIRWSDQGDPNYWQAGVGHQANSRRLQAGKKLMAGTYLANRMSILWSDTSLIAMQYTGNSFIFDTRVIANECGLVGPHAWATVNERAFWRGQSKFFMFGGGGVAPIQNSDDVSEWVTKQIRELYGVKTFCFYAPEFREVWWLFCSTDDREPSYYVAVKLDEWHWIKGSLQRNGGLRFSGDSENPVLVDADGILYEHETGVDAADQDGELQPLESFIQSGPMRLEKGAREMNVFGFMPDFERHEKDLSLSIQARDRINEPFTEVFTTSVEPNVGIDDLHMNGRFVSFELRSNVLGGDFRLGVVQFEAGPGGNRR